MAPETTLLNQELRRLGKMLVAQLFVLFKTSLNYSEGHAAIQPPAANVLKVVREIQRRNEEATLTVKGGHLYLGELRLKLDATRFEASRFVMQELREHLIGSVHFRRAVTVAELGSFAYALRDLEGRTSSDSYGRVLGTLQRRGLVNVEVESFPEEVEIAEIDREKLRDDRLKARMLYKKGVRVMEEAMQSVAAGHPLRLSPAKRVVQHLIDLLGRQEAILLGLITTRCQEPYAENHPVNVCLLSLAMGKRLGFSKFHLCELGMAALFHDIGKAGLPREIRDSGAELTPAQQQALHWHPVVGVQKMMQLKGLDLFTARVIIGIFEHHLRADLSGYPRLPYRRLSLFGRIIGLADSYDALTSSRVNGRTPYPPDQALRYLLSRGGKQYDPALLKLLINCVGIYGIGSVLLLESGELAVVVQNNPDHSRWEFPLVRIISDRDGVEVDGDIVDLAKTGEGRGIATSVDPAPFHLDVSGYFM
jgi:HD-GYP domain-containing protein (c-di-GMP phosphodiesterase class II)